MSKPLAYRARAYRAGDLMQDLKTGHLVGASPRAQFYGQLIGSTFSIFVTTIAYNAYTKLYEIPGPSFPAPTAYVWLNLARLLSEVFTYCLSVVALTPWNRGWESPREEWHFHDRLCHHIRSYLRRKGILCAQTIGGYEVHTLRGSICYRLLEHPIVHNGKTARRSDRSDMDKSSETGGKRWRHYTGRDSKRFCAGRGCYQHCHSRLTELWHRCFNLLGVRSRIVFWMSRRLIVQQTLGCGHE